MRPLRPGPLLVSRRAVLAALPALTLSTPMFSSNACQEAHWEDGHSAECVPRASWLRRQAESEEESSSEEEA